MTRYIISNRRAGRSQPQDMAASRHAVTVAMSQISAAVVSESLPEAPAARHIVVVETDNVAEIARQIRDAPPDVIIEPEIPHYPLFLPPADLRNAKLLGIGVANAGPQISLNVTGGGQPLAEAVVYFFMRTPGGGSSSAQGKTSKSGVVRFNIPPGHTAAAAVVVPRASYWSMIARGPQLNAPIECPPLPANGPVDWWHRMVGQTVYDASAGAGIKVGVLDTGLGPHPSLAHAILIGGFDGDNVDPTAAATLDVRQHGTHVAGTIGGRPVAATDYAGIAPGVDLYAARVFAAEGSSSQAAISNAIDAMADAQVDLINMSLGAASPSETIRDAIQAAAERGVLCIAAAGNDDGPVNYPAAFKEAVAVSALGLEGWAPPGSSSAARLPSQPDRFGMDGLFLANFSCYGNELLCCAPGVGVIAPVPTKSGAGLFGGMDGTSMASPVACAVAAVLLSRDANYQAMPRDLNRTLAARQIIASGTRNIGLDAIYQGRGISTV